MNKISKTAIGALVVSIVALVGAFAFHPTQTIVKQTTQKVGASPDFSNSPILTVNGVDEYYQQENMKIGTTTLCSFANPLVSYGGASSTAHTATTTLQYVSYHITQGIGSAVVIDIGTSTSAQGTTTDLQTGQLVPANTTAFSSGWIAPSFSGGNFDSGTFLNIVAATTSTSTMNYQGYCQAEWTVI